MEQAHHKPSEDAAERVTSTNRKPTAIKNESGPRCE